MSEKEIKEVANRLSNMTKSLGVSVKDYFQNHSKVKDERDFEELDDVERSALFKIKEWGNSRKKIDEIWDEVRNNKNKYKVWKREKDRLEFKVAKQELKNAWISSVRRMLNTPWYELPWYEKITIGPLVLWLKGVNWCLQKMTRW